MNDMKKYIGLLESHNWSQNKIVKALKIKGFSEAEIKQYTDKPDLKSLSETLRDKIMVSAKKLSDELKKQKVPTNAILKRLRKEFKTLSSFDYLEILENNVGVPITGNLKAVNEKTSGNVENHILIVNESGLEYNIIGTIKHEFYENLIKECEDLCVNEHCNLCESEYHSEEDCTNIEKMCESHEKKILDFCINIKSEVNETFSNKQVFQFLVDMNEAKQNKNNKYFIHENVKYSIEEQTKILKEHLEDFEPKNVYGTVNGNIYEVFDDTYPKCSFININTFSRTK